MSQVRPSAGLVPDSARRSDPADPRKEEACSSGGPHQSHPKPDLCRFGRRGCLRGRRHVLPAGGRVTGALRVGDRGGVGAVGILRGLVRSRIAVLSGILAVLLRPGGGSTGLTVRLRAGRRTGGIRGCAERRRSARRRDGTLGSRALRCCALGCRAGGRRRRGRGRRRGLRRRGRWGGRRSRRGRRSGRG
jgi:hypothetical protein